MPSNDDKDSPAVIKASCSWRRHIYIYIYIVCWNFNWKSAQLEVQYKNDGLRNVVLTICLSVCLSLPRRVLSRILCFYKILKSVLNIRKQSLRAVPPKQSFAAKYLTNTHDRPRFHQNGRHTACSFTENEAPREFYRYTKIEWLY